MRRMYDCMGKDADVAQQMLFLLSAGGTKRFHNHPTINPNTVAQHSWGVAWFCWHLTAGKASAKLLMAALAHDMGETVWGDLPSPAKRYLDMEATLTVLEEKTLGENKALFVLSEEEEYILALADRFDCAMYAIQERRLGNKNMDTVFAWVKDALNNTKMNQHQTDVFYALVDLWEESL